MTRERSTMRIRTGGAVMVCGLSMAGSWPLVAAPLIGSQTASPVRVPNDVDVEVRVDPEIEGAQDLGQWVEQEIRRLLAARASGAPLNGTLQVEISGRLYDYQASLSARRGQDLLGSSDVWRCECSNEELLEMVRDRIPAIVEHLEVMLEEPSETRTTPSVERRPEVVDGRYQPDRGTDRLGRVGVAGVVLMTLGAAGLATGVPLIVLNDWPEPPEKFWVEYSTRPFRTSGIAVAGVGTAALVTGVVLYAVRGRLGRRRARALTLAPSLDGHGYPIFSASGSF